MAKAVRTNTEHQKEFAHLFDSLCGRYSRWEVWADFITMAAIEISNATDKANAEERGKSYALIAKKYVADFK